MANDNNGWDVDDIDFSEIDFEDLDLDDLDFSIDGDLNSISDERPAASAPVNRPTVSGHTPVPSGCAAFPPGAETRKACLR